MRRGISAAAFMAAFSSAGRIDPAPGPKPHAIAITCLHDVTTIRAAAAGPFTIVYTTGRFESYAPKGTEATGWIRTASGKVAVQ